MDRTNVILESHQISGDSVEVSEGQSKANARSSRKAANRAKVLPGIIEQWNKLEKFSDYQNLSIDDVLVEGDLPNQFPLFPDVQEGFKPFCDGTSFNSAYAWRYFEDNLFDMSSEHLILMASIKPHRMKCPQKIPNNYLYIQRRKADLAEAKDLRARGAISAKHYQGVKDHRMVIRDGNVYQIRDSAGNKMNKVVVAVVTAASAMVKQVECADIPPITRPIELVIYWMAVVNVVILVLCFIMYYFFRTGYGIVYTIRGKEEMERQLATMPPGARPIDEIKELDRVRIQHGADSDEYITRLHFLLYRRKAYVHPLCMAHYTAESVADVIASYKKLFQPVNVSNGFDPNIHKLATFTNNQQALRHRPQPGSG